MTTSYQFPHAVPGPASVQSPTWHCGDPFAEQRSAHHNGALIDFRHLAVLSISGEDSPSWLHSLLSQKVVDMPADSTTRSELRRAHVLDAHGHILEECWVARTSDGYLLATPQSHQHSLLDYLTSMMFWSRVTVTATDHTVTAILGPIAPEDAADVAQSTSEAPENTTASPAATAIENNGLPLPQHPLTPPAPAPRPPLSAPIADIIENNNLVAAGGYPRGLPLTLLFVPPTADLPAVVDALLATDLTAAGSWTWDALRCATGLPEITTDVDERSLPHEYDAVGDPATGAAASVTKGCYRGQETVAKIHNVGLPPRRQVVLLLDGSSELRPTPGTALYADPEQKKVAGRIGTVADHWEYGPMALALIRRTVDDATELTWKTDEGTGSVAIVSELSVHPAEHRAGRDAVQNFRSSARQRNL